jgi:two-component system OmpR family response regulator
VTDPQVLIVEDNSELRDVLVRGLAEEGFASRAVATATEALERVNASPPDVLVIDVGLPDADGRDLCQALRAAGIQAPVLFLTARDAVVDRLAGFDAGGDDYVTKPFEFAEVVARLHALLRRAGVDGAQEAAGLRLDPVTHAVASGETSAALTPTEFRLLARLLNHPGEAVRRRQLVYAAWPQGAIVHDNTLDVYIARLRNKLRALPDAPRIETVHGVGYTLR